MYRFGRKSMGVIDTLHPSYRPPLMDIIKIVDITMIEGARIKERQNMLLTTGATTVEWPDSSHNLLKPEHKSFGFDAMPYTPGFPGGVDWRTSDELWAAIKRGDTKEAQAILENIRRIRQTAGIVIGVFHVHGIPLINGADWNGDGWFKDHGFTDSPHYQHKDWRRLRNEL